MATTTLEPTRQERKAERWITFAGLMMILAGALDVFDALWAFSAQDTAFDALFYDNNIEAWGWFYLILGAVLVVGGFAVFSRARWAVLTGIAVTIVAAMINFFWIFVHPLATVVIVTLNVLVAYALTMYGFEEEPTAEP
jgi:hypothetical protein